MSFLSSRNKRWSDRARRDKGLMFTCHEAMLDRQWFVIGRDGAEELYTPAPLERARIVKIVERYWGLGLWAILSRLALTVYGLLLTSVSSDNLRLQLNAFRLELEAANHAAWKLVCVHVGSRHLASICLTPRLLRPPVSLRSC